MRICRRFADRAEDNACAMNRSVQDHTSARTAYCSANGCPRSRFGTYLPDGVFQRYVKPELDLRGKLAGAFHACRSGLLRVFIPLAVWASKKHRRVRDKLSST